MTWLNTHIEPATATSLSYGHSSHDDTTLTLIKTGCVESQPLKQGRVDDNFLHPHLSLRYNNLHLSQQVLQQVQYVWRKVLLAYCPSHIKLTSLEFNITTLTVPPIFQATQEEFQAEGKISEMRANKCEETYSLFGNEHIIASFELRLSGRADAWFKALNLNWLQSLPWETNHMDKCLFHQELTTKLFKSLVHISCIYLLCVLVFDGEVSVTDHC